MLIKMICTFKKEKKKSFLSANLTYLLSQHSLDIKQLSIATGVPAATLARLKRDSGNPTVSSIEPLIDFFRVEMDAFLYEDLSSLEYKNKKKMGNLVPISVYSLEEIAHGRKNAKVLKFIGAAGITSEDVFGVAINSDVLKPAFQSNSIVIIEPNLKPVEGDYVLCNLSDSSNDAPVFRQIFMNGNDFYFKPVNPGFGEMKHFERYKIIGVVTKSIESYR
ncbi:S24 family peptidase [Legionella sp.]|uniref:S24 family peptidase n=1 Tax=Legionella sp. TaxID=459 RepID=UPI003C93EC3C